MRAGRSWRLRLPTTATVKARLSSWVLGRRVSSRWLSQQSDALQRRHYSSYDAYVAHQKAKLSRISLADYDAEYRAMLRERLAQNEAVKSGMSVLCLAARLGTEVKAFTDLGCFAVGIDLNPGPDNHYVLHGDFHHLQFADSSADAVFTNSLDHCFDIGAVVREVRRVLKPTGVFVVEAVRGVREGCAPLFYESFAWARIADLIASVEQGGFRCRSQASFDRPWPGQHLLFDVAPRQNDTD